MSVQTRIKEVRDVLRSPVSTSARNRQQIMIGLQDCGAALVRANLKIMGTEN